MPALADTVMVIVLPGVGAVTWFGVFVSAVICLDCPCANVKAVRPRPAVTYLQLSGDGADRPRGVLRDVEVPAVLDHADHEREERNHDEGELDRGGASLTPSSLAP